MKARNGIVIEVKDLVKKYSDITAIDGVSFEIREGEIFGIIGPNGAGKTTTIECIEGLRCPDQGNVQVLGLSPQRNGYQLREHIGVQLQESDLPDRIQVWEVMDMFASFYSRSVEWYPLLEQFNLADKYKSSFTKLSGGQKQRLFIALALINDPDLIFLDELTTGLDPQARRAMWDLIRGIREQGKTIFLTTHFMEEAERLCDRVAIMDHGKIVALDTPENLIRSLGLENRVVFTIDKSFDKNSLKSLSGVTRVEQIGERVVVYGQEDLLISSVVNALDKEGVHFKSLRTEQPSLEDVFLVLTGKEMRE